MGLLSQIVPRPASLLPSAKFMRPVQDSSQKQRSGKELRRGQRLQAWLPVAQHLAAAQTGSTGIPTVADNLLPPFGGGRQHQPRQVPVGKPSTAPNPKEAGGQGVGSQALSPYSSPRGDAKQDWTLPAERRSDAPALLGTGDGAWSESSALPAQGSGDAAWQGWRAGAGMARDGTGCRAGLRAAGRAARGAHWRGHCC